MLITLPWPFKGLSPNDRVHRMKLARIKRDYRWACFFQAKEAGAPDAALSAADRIEVLLTFYPPTKRARDEDNLLATMKSGLDGLADALQVNDNRFIPKVEISSDIGGMVKVQLRPINSQEQRT